MKSSRIVIFISGSRLKINAGPCPSNDDGYLRTYIGVSYVLTRGPRNIFYRYFTKSSRKELAERNPRHSSVRPKACTFKSKRNTRINFLPRGMFVPKKGNGDSRIIRWQEKTSREGCINSRAPEAWVGQVVLSPTATPPG